MFEKKEYLTEQIITYLGNKRSLLDFIKEAIELVLFELNKTKIDTFDVFSGSGIVARFLKQYSTNLYVNDLEDYSRVLNQCYLTNNEEIQENKLHFWFNKVNTLLHTEPLITNGFIYRLYAPQNDIDIQPEERVFYTTRNAQFLDTARTYLDIVPEPYRTLLLGPLLYEASTKTNTSGVFKGFYKNSTTHIGQFGGNGQNALSRIKANIELKLPILSAFNSKTHILQGDSNLVCETIPQVDLAYLDPPYNQHPYGSNYFMLNLITNYNEPKNISRVSGIPTDWKQSSYNKRAFALKNLSSLCDNIKSTYLLISYNSEGFISFNDMIDMLQSFGSVRVFDKKYNVFRGCRNLSMRSHYVKEYLFLLKKGH